MEPIDENMPFYRFVCSNCGVEEKKLLSRKQLDAFSGSCRVCATPLVQMIGTPEVRSVETADEYHGKKMVTGSEQMVEERAKDHFRKHELPRIIAEKGIQYAKESGLVDQDGNPK